MAQNKYVNYQFYYTPTKFAEDTIIVSDAIGYNASPAFHYNRDTFNNNLVLYVLKGTLYVVQYGEKHILKAGQGILMKLTDHHNYYSDKKDVAHLIWFHFRGNPVNPIINKLYDNECLPIIFNEHNFSNSIYKCFNITFIANIDFEYEISSIIYQIVMDIVKPYLLKIGRGQMQANSWFVDKVKRYVDDNIYDRLDLNMLSKCVNMNKYYFSKLFTEYFNTSPIQYVLKRKIQLSMQLLSDTYQSLDTIAHSLGFSDQSHFCKTFKKNTGISPLVYRKIAHTSLVCSNESDLI